MENQIVLRVIDPNNESDDTDQGLNNEDESSCSEGDQNADYTKV